MEDYYRLLDSHYEASIDELNNSYKNKIIYFKSLPFLTDNDKEQLKKIKKANIIFNNFEYKKIYDKYLENKFKKEINIVKKKNMQNSNYIVDRIFDIKLNNNQQPININHNELLRPKNVGLSSDKIPEFDEPLDFKESSDFLPYNYDS
jgi:DnaJ-class molecular chaperone